MSKTSKISLKFQNLLSKGFCKNKNKLLIFLLLEGRIRAQAQSNQRKPKANSVKGSLLAIFWALPWYLSHFSNPIFYSLHGFSPGSRMATIVLSSHSMVPPKHGISKNTSVSATGMLHHQQALLASLQELTLPLGTKLQLLFMIQSWGSHRNEGFTQTNGLSWFLMTSNLTLSFL